jgi:hypothetical protein
VAGGLAGLRFEPQLRNDHVGECGPDYFERYREAGFELELLRSDGSQEPRTKPPHQRKWPACSPLPAFLLSAFEKQPYETTRSGIPFRDQRFCDDPLSRQRDLQEA